MGAEMCDITPGDVIAVWGAGPVGQFAIAAAKLLGTERVIVIDRVPERLRMAATKAGATDVVNYEETPVLEALQELTGGRGPDACIDAVGMEGTPPPRWAPTTASSRRRGWRPSGRSHSGRRSCRVGGVALSP